MDYPDCGVKVEKVPLLFSKALFSSASKTPWARRAGAAGGAAVRVGREHDGGDQPGISAALAREPTGTGTAAGLLPAHLDGILNYCRTMVPRGRG